MIAVKLHFVAHVYVPTCEADCLASVQAMSMNASSMYVCMYVMYVINVCMYVCMYVCMSCMLYVASGSGAERVRQFLCKERKAARVQTQRSLFCLVFRIFFRRNIHSFDADVLNSSVVCDCGVHLSFVLVKHGPSARAHSFDVLNGQ